MNFKFILTAIGFTLFIGCSSTKSIYTQKTTVPYGKITTEGVEIVAEDGGFHLKYGERWVPPFQNVTTNEGMHGSNVDMISFHKTAKEKFGAKKVRVKTPYMSKDLHGLLLLSKIYDGCDGAVTRSYQISIPESYVSDALDGKISVVYEYYNAPCGNVGVSAKPKTWVLWLSDIPF